jgi:hypothetical protein
VVAGERGEVLRLGEAQREAQKSGLVDPLDDVIGHAQPSEAGLDRDFPDRDRAYEDRVGRVRDGETRVLRKLSVAFEHPDQRMRIEQELHLRGGNTGPSFQRAISSGVMGASHPSE